MGYWGYVRRRAYVEAREYVRDRFGRAMIFGIVSGAAVIVVRFAGAEGEWWNDFIAVTVWIGAMALVFGCLFVIRFFSVPVQMRRGALNIARQGRDERAALNNEIKRLSASPEKALRFRWNVPTHTPMRGSDLVVHVTNESGQTIDGVEVELFNIHDLRHPMGMPVSLELLAVEGGRSVSLHPRQTKAFRVASVPPSLYPNSGHQETLDVAPGTPAEQTHPRTDYAFSVRASGRDVPEPEEAIYELKFAPPGYSFGPQTAQVTDQK